jgi:hypothetical protein
VFSVIGRIDKLSHVAASMWMRQVAWGGFVCYGITVRGVTMTSRKVEPTKRALGPIRITRIDPVVPANNNRTYFRCARALWPCCRGRAAERDAMCLCQCRGLHRELPDRPSVSQVPIPCHPWIRARDHHHHQPTVETGVQVLVAERERGGCLACLNSTSPLWFSIISPPRRKLSTSPPRVAAFVSLAPLWIGLSCPARCSWL